MSGKNGVLWALRGIKDTETLRVACEELERVLYDLNNSFAFEVGPELGDALEEASAGLYKVVKALPARNTSLEDGIFTEEN